MLTLNQMELIFLGFILIDANNDGLLDAKDIF